MPSPPPSNAIHVFHGHILDFWQWEQPQFDGSIETFECVTRPDTVTVLGFLDRETILLTKQEQPSKPIPFFDFPGGRVDKGENQVKAAQRELLEETGYAAAEWYEWHRIPQIGIIRLEEVFYLAKGLQKITKPHLDQGERIETMEISWKDLVKMCLKRQLRQPNIMLAVLQMEFDPDNQKRLMDWLG